MVDPPFELGAVQETKDCESELEVPATLVGAPGTTTMVVELVAELAGPVPKALVAFTVKV
jgi:hypothetical protein